ncbi:hypothetical protein D3C80_1286980 [compost metagenome]
MTDIRRITDKLQKNASYLVAAHQYIVRPLQPGISNALLTQCLQHSQADYQTQPFELAHPPFNPQHQAVVEVFCKWTDPSPPTPSSSSGLTLRQHQERSLLTPLDGTQGLGVGRVDSIEDQHWPTLTRGCLFDGIFVEQ